MAELSLYIFRVTVVATKYQQRLSPHLCGPRATPAKCRPKTSNCARDGKRPVSSEQLKLKRKQN